MLSRFFQHIIRANSGPVVVVEPDKAIIVRPAESFVIGASDSVLIQPVAPVLIQPPLRGAWQEKGWTRKLNAGSATYSGQYIVNNKLLGQKQHFQGRIEVANHEIIPFVADPPTGLSSHPKGPCFSMVSPGWFRVHWHRPPNNVDDAILYVERVLNEVLNRRFL